MQLREAPVGRQARRLLLWLVLLVAFRVRVRLALVLVVAGWRRVVGGGEGGLPVVVVVVIAIVGCGCVGFCGGVALVGQDDAVLADVGDEVRSQGDDARADARGAVSGEL